GGLVERLLELARVRLFDELDIRIPMQIGEAGEEVIGPGILTLRLLRGIAERAGRRDPNPVPELTSTSILEDLGARLSPRNEQLRAQQLPRIFEVEALPPARSPSGFDDRRVTFVENPERRCVPHGAGEGEVGIRGAHRGEALVERSIFRKTRGDVRNECLR